MPARDVTILAADTEVVHEGQVLGKPADAADAARMLRLLSGRTHEVLTAVVVVTGDAGAFGGGADDGPIYAAD